MADQHRQIPILTAAHTPSPALLFPLLPKMAPRIASKELNTKLKSTSREKKMRRAEAAVIQERTKLEKNRCSNRAIAEIHGVRPSLLNARLTYLFAMDETGSGLGVAGKMKVVGAARQAIQHIRQDGNRENVTIMVTICADGTRLRDTIIFKGKRFQARWMSRNEADLQ